MTRYLRYALATMAAALFAAVAALAQDADLPTDLAEGPVVLRPEGPPFLLARLIEQQVVYRVPDPTRDGAIALGKPTARFLVLANSSYRIDVTFPTWQPDPPATREFLQGAFSNGRHRIAGRLFLDPSPQGRRRGDRILHAADGTLQAEGQRGVNMWGLGAEISARLTDNPAGIAEAGTYTLDAVITIQPR